jgi:hypothetical protein
MPDYQKYLKSQIVKEFKKQDRKKENLEKICHELWREIVYARAKYKCEYYGCQREASNPHHIYTKGHSKHLRFDIENGLALCFRHHTGSNEAAHNDIFFKDKIVGKYPGYQPIRTEEWLDKLDRKAAMPCKLDLQMEKLYLESELKKLTINLGIDAEKII